MGDADRERAETLRKVFDPGTPDGAVRAALARVLSLELPPPVGHPVVLATTQGLAGWTVGRQSVVGAVHDTVRRALSGEPPSPGDVSARADGRRR